MRQEKESINALKDIGKLHFLGLPDGDLGDHLNHKIIIKEKIKVTKPDVVITHYKEDYHSDHRILLIMSQILQAMMFQLYFRYHDGLEIYTKLLRRYYKIFKAKQNAIMKHKSQIQKGL